MKRQQSTASASLQKQLRRYRIALWGVLAVILLALGTAGYLVFVPKVSQTTTTTTETTPATAVSVKLTSSQLQNLLNYAVKKAVSKQSISYRFVVGDNVTLVGTTKILGTAVSFSLRTKPQVTKNGNLQLKAESVGVGSLSVPVSYILNYVKNNYQLPAGISIDTSTKSIVLNLKKLTQSTMITLQAQKIDATKHLYYFKVGVPKS